MAIQDLYPITPYIRQSYEPVPLLAPGLSELESAIRERVNEELYARGYGEQRFGNLDLGRNWGVIAAILIGAYLLWGK